MGNDVSVHWKDGYDRGYGSGYADGQSQGYNETYTKARNKAYNEGKKVGYELALPKGLKKGRLQGQLKASQVGFSDGFQSTEEFKMGYAEGSNNGFRDVLFYISVMVIGTVVSGVGMWYMMKWYRQWFNPTSASMVVNDNDKNKKKALIIKIPKIVQHQTTGNESLLHDWSLLFERTVLVTKNSNNYNNYEEKFANDQSVVVLKVYRNSQNFQIFYAHKDVLYVRSPYFEELLESKPGIREIEITEWIMEPDSAIIVEVFPSVLSWMYKGTLVPMNLQVSTILALLKWAQLCKLMQLTNRCVEQLIRRLDMGNVVEVYTVSKKFQLDRLQRACETIIRAQSSDDLAKTAVQLMTPPPNQ